MRGRERVLCRLLSLAAVALPAPVLACSICACGDPLLATSDPAAIAGRLRLQYDVEYLRMNAGTEGSPGFTDELTQWSHRLNLAWRPTDRLTATATLPLVAKTIDTVGGGSRTRSSSATGLGDLEVAVRYAPWRRRDLGIGRVQELAVSAGSSTPTGPNDLTAGGDRIDEHGQPGTGSFGPFLGVHYRIEQVEWTTYASVSGRVRTENSFGYRYGAALLWSVHAQYLWSGAAAVDLGIDGRFAAVDRQDGAAVENTGGTVVALAPALYVNPFRDAWLFVRGQLPFATAFHGEQRQFPSIVAGVQYQIF